ncbi:MAG: response regulator transcription factor [bacterium]
MSQRIYSVEDDVNIGHIINIALTNSGYSVTTYTEGKSLFSAMEVNMPDLILLDIMLPDMDGLAILNLLKTNVALRTIPVMIISAKDAELDRVIGLDAGADDYLVKPFGVLELISRVKALLRRNEQKETESITGGGVTMNVEEHTCRYGESVITLTAKEFSLLWLMITNKNKTLTRETILNAVWGFDFVGETRTLDVHIKEIRQKLARAGVVAEPISTIRGIGYKFLE